MERAVGAERYPLLKVRGALDHPRLLVQSLEAEVEKTLGGEAAVRDHRIIVGLQENRNRIPIPGAGNLVSGAARDRHHGLRSPGSIGGQQLKAGEGGAGPDAEQPVPGIGLDPELARGGSRPRVPQSAVVGLREPSPEAFRVDPVTTREQPCRGSRSVKWSLAGPRAVT